MCRKPLIPTALDFTTLIFLCTHLTSVPTRRATAGAVLAWWSPTATRQTTSLSSGRLLRHGRRDQPTWSSRSAEDPWASTQSTTCAGAPVQQVTNKAMRNHICRESPNIRLQFASVHAWSADTYVKAEGTLSQNFFVHGKDATAGGRKKTLGIGYQCCV